MTYMSRVIHVGGLHVVNVNDPRNPQFAGCFGDDGYVHDAQCVNYHGPDARYVTYTCNKVVNTQNVCTGKGYILEYVIQLDGEQN